MLLSNSWLVMACLNSQGKGYNFSSIVFSDTASLCMGGMLINGKFKIFTGEEKPHGTSSHRN